MRTRTRRTTTRPLTLTEAAVLALLGMHGESSGYDLLKKAQRSVGYIWAPAKTQLYAVLPRLVAAGLARTRKVRQADRPDKQLYRITAPGRRALKAWLETVEEGNRDAFYLKLFVGGLGSPEAIVAQIEQYRLEVSERLAELRAIRNDRRGHSYYHYFLLRLGIEEYEVRRRWADWVLGELRGTR